MGQCYSVELAVKYKNGNCGMRSARRALQGKILTDQMYENTTYSLEKWNKDNCDPLASDVNIDELFRVFLADWDKRSDFVDHNENAEWTTYYSYFDACYGWESILSEMFEAISPYLENGSMIEVFPDSGHWSKKIINGALKDSY